MSSLTDQLAEHGIGDPDDVEWLQLLVGDWQLLADLAFADLLLWLPGPDGTWTVGAHCRPTTAMTVYPHDQIGRLADERERVLVERVAERQLPVSAAIAGLTAKSLRETEAVPVVRAGRQLGVLSVHRQPGRADDRNSLQEQQYVRCASALLRMIATGYFPDVTAPSHARRGEPRVGDGLFIIDADGRVVYSSPNAVSLLHRMGHRADIRGAYLAQIFTELTEQLRPVDETLPLVLTGRVPWRTEVESGRVSVTMRSIPLIDGGDRTGALILSRDISDLRRRERDLLSRDAMIREMHHRVKNNLQTVAALLRLQSRRMSSAEAKEALDEAMRRVAIIAVVHDTLSQGTGPEVDFDEIVDKGMRLTPELASPQVNITVVREGGFGKISAVDATSLALALTELITNAVEHGFPQRGDQGDVEGRIWVRPKRCGDRLQVTVADDGVGFDEATGPGTGLGTQIIKTLVTSDLAGTIDWHAREGGGTEVVLDVPLRPDRL